MSKTCRLALTTPLDGSEAMRAVPRWWAAEVYCSVHSPANLSGLVWYCFELRPWLSTARAKSETERVSRASGCQWIDAMGYPEASRDWGERLTRLSRLGTCSAK